MVYQMSKYRARGNGAYTVKTDMSELEKTTIIVQNPGLNA